MYLITSIVLIVMSLSALVGCAMPSEALTYPTTRVGNRAAAFFSAYNGGDEAALRRYVETHFDPRVLDKVPVDELVRLIREMWEEIGPLTPEVIRKQTPTELTLHARGEKTSKMWFEAQFAVTDASPAKLRTFSVNPGLSPDLADKSYGEWQSLTDLAREVARDSGVPGLAVVVIRDDQIDTAVWGVRVQGLPEVIHQDDRFHFGSITKSITSTMLGKLVELGVIDWNTRVADVLSDMEMHPAYRTVTLEELLQHRGGVVSHRRLPYSDDQLADLKSGTPTAQRAAYVADVLNREPIAPSGERMHYSNAGYVIAGHMAERASGQLWETLVQTHVFTPLNMSNSAFGWPATVKRPNQPRGHRIDDTTLTPQALDDTDEVGTFMAPAGDVHGSIADLAAYAVAHLNGLQGHDGILKAETMRRLHTAPVPVKEGAPYAAGWVVQERWDSGVWHWHNGSTGAFYALVMIHPASRMAVAVAMNAAPGSHEPVAKKMVHAIYRKAQDVTAN